MHTPTLSPIPDEHDAYRAVLAALREGCAPSLQRVVAGETLSVPAGALALTLDVVRRLADGESVAIQSLPPDREVTFAEAADILNLPHRHFTHLVEKGRVPLPLCAGDDHLRLSDVLRYKAARNVLQDLALQVLADEAQKHGLGY